MPKIERVDNELKKALNDVIRFKVKDPRLDGLIISVTEVSTTKDLKYAKVYVSVLQDDKQKEVIKVLNSANAFIRSLLFDMVKLRLVPNLTFILDDSMQNGMKIDEIIKKLHEDNNAE